MFSKCASYCIFESCFFLFAVNSKSCLNFYGLKNEAVSCAYAVYRRTSTCSCEVAFTHIIRVCYSDYNMCYFNQPYVFACT